MKLIWLSVREIRKKKFFSLLTLAVSVIAMQTVLSAVTNAASAAYQQRTFESSLGTSMETVLHLDYRQTEENPELAAVIRQYLDYIRQLPGVEAVGQFDASGVYFSELEAMEEYQTINGQLLKGQKYENYPAISRLLSADEEVLSLVKGGVTEYTAAAERFLPLYVSEVFADILPQGRVLTDARTGDKYQVVGYIPKGTQWVSEDDLIRFPMVSLDGWFVAPFTAQSRSDWMTQLSSLHNTYIFLSDSADTDRIKEQISAYSLQHGFEACGILLSEEYGAYQAETAAFTGRQIILALFISGMALCSVVAVCTTGVLLKKKQYGVLLANGFTLFEIAAGIVLELSILIFFAGIFSWTAKWLELMHSTDLFKTVLLAAHIRFTLPLCAVLCCLAAAAAAVLPILTLFKYHPCELIEGDTNGND